MDKNALLIEMNEILGHEKVVQDLESSAPTPRSVTRSFMVPGNAAVDDMVLESLSQMTWEDVFQFASFSLLPEEEVIYLARSLAESTAAFREAWVRINERFELPDGM